jgi:hypothetical protein
MDAHRDHSPTVVLVGHPPHIGRLLELLVRGEGLPSRAVDDEESLVTEALAGRVLAIMSAEGVAEGAAERDGWEPGCALAARFWADPRLQAVPFLVVTSRPGADRIHRTPNVRRIISTPFSPRAFVADLHMLAPRAVRLRAA